MTEVKKPSASMLIQQEDQHKLMAYGEDLNRGAWGIGRIAAGYATEYLYEDENGRRWLKWEVRGKALRLPAQTLWNAVGQFCGKSGHTVRSYERYAQLIPRRIEREYDMLFYSHHKLISDAVKGDLDEHILLCDAVLEEAHNWGGNIMSVSTLAMWLDERNGRPARWIRRRQRFITSAEKLAGDEDVDELTREVARYVVERLK